MTKRKPPASGFEANLDHAVSLAKALGQKYIVLESKITHACRHVTDDSWRKGDWEIGDEWHLVAEVSPEGNVRFVG